MKSYADRNKFYKRKQTPSPGLRRELSALLFDLIVDGVPNELAEQRIIKASRTDTERAMALGRWRICAGSITVGVK